MDRSVALCVCMVVALGCSEPAPSAPDTQMLVDTRVEPDTAPDTTTGVDTEETPRDVPEDTEPASDVAEVSDTSADTADVDIPCDDDADCPASLPECLFVPGAGTQRYCREELSDVPIISDVTTDSCPSCEASETCCDGVCVDTQTEGEHCGACGAACRAGELCVDGACSCAGGSACAEGEACCGGSCVADSDAQCQCEGGSTVCGIGEQCCDDQCTDIASSALHCGGCGLTCARPHIGNAFCEQAACTIAFCADGYGDCNGVVDDGCEVDLATELSPLRCGACDVDCRTLEQSTGLAQTCVACDPGDSACEIAQCAATGCAAQSADCDSEPSDCEVKTDDNPQNCGGCGVGCGPAGVCRDSQCDSVVAITGGTSTTCVLRGEGQGVCWGDARFGMLGYDAGGPLKKDAPDMPIDTTEVLQAVAGKGVSFCAITDGGDVVCWGDNTEGQLGGPAPAFADTPIPVSFASLSPTPSGFSLISAGIEHHCASDGGDVYCWGANTQGQLGVPSGSMVKVQGLPSGAVTQLDGGNYHTCAAVGGELSCWGLRSSGQLGPSSLTPPLQVPLPAGEITDVVGGISHTCAVVDAGLKAEAYCWGDNTQGQLGTGNFNDSSPEGAVEQVSLNPACRPEAMASGVRFNCALCVSGQIHCWGSNINGQLGRETLGNEDPRPGPVVKANGSALLADVIGAGNSHVCARERSTGAMWCWGENSSGQLGNGTSTSTEIPQKILAFPSR